MSQLVEHKNWNKLKPWVYLQYYNGQPKKGSAVRYRRKFSLLAPEKIVALALCTITECPCCNEKVFPFRWGRGDLDVSITCELKKSVSCSRRKKPGTGKTYASIECERIEASINHRGIPVDPEQTELF